MKTRKYETEYTNTCVYIKNNLLFVLFNKKQLFSSSALQMV